MVKHEGMERTLSRWYGNVSDVDSDELEEMMDGMDEFDLEENLEEDPEYFQDDAMPEKFLKDAPTGEVGQEEGVPEKPKVIGAMPGI